MKRIEKLEEVWKKLIKNKQFPVRVALIEYLYYYDGKDLDNFKDQINKQRYNYIDASDLFVVKDGEVYYHNGRNTITKLTIGLYTIHHCDLRPFNKNLFYEFGLEGCDWEVIKHEK